MPRSGCVSVPRRLSFELEEAFPTASYTPQILQSSPNGPREYESWPGDSFFLLPDSVLNMDANAFRADLKIFDPVLSASLPDWPLDPNIMPQLAVSSSNYSGPPSHTKVKATSCRDQLRSFTLLDNHEGLTVRSVGKGTVLIGGGGDVGGGSSSTMVDGTASAGGITTLSTSTNGPCSTPQQQHKYTPTNPSQKESTSGLSFKDREDRVRQLRVRQQLERQHKLEELKEQAVAAHRFREQQETVRRQRLDDIRSRDFERRNQVEERKRIIQQAEQLRRESVVRKTAERDQRLEHKRRQERSNAVFAFGSSTPRMLDPKENHIYWGSRRATSTTNVNMCDSSSSVRRTSESQESDLSRKRATSAHSLNRKPEGDDPILSRSTMGTTAARRRTDLTPSTPSSRDNRHRSPGRALFFDQLASKGGRHARTNTPTLAPLHESPRNKRVSSMSKSMSHLGPQRARTPIGPATDGEGVPVVQGSLDRRSSRSSLAIAHPRMTRSELLRLKLREANRNSDGIHSGINTPSSRPNSALSHASGGSSQVMLRNKPSPKKPRPLSIAGSVPTAADKPRPIIAAASPNRESRSMERKTSAGGMSSVTSATKASRAKSAGSDQSAPSTPSKSRGATPKRTPAQVKADSASRKALKARIPPKTAATPVQSISLESKPIPEEKKPKSSPQGSKVSSKSSSKESSQTDLKVTLVETHKEVKQSREEKQVPVAKDISQIGNLLKEESAKTDEKLNTSSQKEAAANTQDTPVVAPEVAVVTLVEEALSVDNSSLSKKDPPSSEAPKDDTEDEKALLQKTSEKPVTGYATEEEYKAALTEKRRQAREAKERELELERQRQLDEEERERREEEDYLKLIEEQKKVEAERLQKAIEEAEKQREDDKIKAKEDEKIRLEAEKIEQQKKFEAEERAKKEEEDRQLRKSRVAAIMSRTRGKGVSTTPTKAESKTPSEEVKNIMTESFISSISSSMTESMIVQAIESREEFKKQEDVTSDLSSEPPSDFSSQPPSDVSSHATSTLELSSQPSSGIHSECGSVVSQDTEKEELSHFNGTSPMDITPTPDLSGGSLRGVNGINHNGVKSSDKPDNLLGDFDPLNSETTTSSSKSETTFDQIIDLNPSKLTNEDAVNRNSPPHPPFIAFEDNLNKKSNQDTSSNVPDLLL